MTQIYKLNELSSRNPDEELVPGLIDQGLVMVIGKPASGKTFFGIHVGAHVSTGADWNGRRVEKGAVIYCIAEGTSHFSHRVTTYLDHIGFHVDDADFYIVPTSFNMRSNTDGEVGGEIEELQHSIDILGVTPRLMVFDTLNRYMPGGDENNQQDCSALVRGVEHFRNLYGCTVMLMHHMKKDGSLPRGSTVLTGAADQVIHAVDRKGSLVDKPMKWTTKGAGKRKDRDDVEQWFEFKSVGMSRGLMARRTDHDDMFDDYVFKTMYDENGEEVPSNVVEDTLIMLPIAPPENDDSEDDLDQKEKTLLAHVTAHPDGVRVRETMRALEWSNTKFYDAANALEAAGKVAWDENKRLRLVTSPNPFQPY